MNLCSTVATRQDKTVGALNGKGRKGQEKYSEIKEREKKIQ